MRGLICASSYADHIRSETDSEGAHDRCIWQDSSVLTRSVVHVDAGLVPVVLAVAPVDGRSVPPCPSGFPHEPAGAELLLRNCQSSVACQVRAGLYREGDPFDFLHAVRTGSLKSCLSLPDGRKQVSSFHLAGEVIGLEGVSDGRHHCTVTALEDSQTSSVASSSFLGSAAGTRTSQRDLLRLQSDELMRVRWHLWLLGQLSARERLASFLLDLSQRSLAQGHSAREFNLSMTRAEIGSYLGLTLETVSRTLSVFRDLNYLVVASRQIRITDLAGFSDTFKAQRH